MRTRAGVAGATLAALTLVSLVALDVAEPGGRISLAPLFVLAPMIACAVLPVSWTAAFGVAALGAALASGAWNGNADDPQHAVRLADVAVLAVVAVVISAVRIHRERQLSRLSRLAEVAQRAVLPVLPVHARRTDIAYRYQSAAEDAVIGGDLYDCYHSRHHTRFLIGDVRGKGISAVEQAARVIRAFRQAAAIQTELDAVAEDMSLYLLPFFDDEEFVTALLLDVTDADRPLLVNAGHPPPLLIRSDGSCEFLESTPNLPLGLGAEYEAGRFEWRPGDRLLLYTDGVSEARDENGEFLDLSRLGPRLVGVPLNAALDRLLDGIRDHAAGGDLTDDVAVLLLEHSTSGKEHRPVAGEHDWRLAFLQ